MVSRAPRAATVFLGGGTPTLLDDGEIARLLAALESPAAPKNREEEAARAKARSAQRFGA